jgi:hypothetical protein
VTWKKELKTINFSSSTGLYWSQSRKRNYVCRLRSWNTHFERIINTLRPYRKKEEESPISYQSLYQFFFDSKICFSFLHLSDLSPVLLYCFIVLFLIGYRRFSTGIKHPGREVEHSNPPSTWTTKEYIYSPFPAYDFLATTRTTLLFNWWIFSGGVGMWRLKRNDSCRYHYGVRT